MIRPKKMDATGLDGHVATWFVPSLSLICSFVKSRVPNDPRSIVVGYRLIRQPAVEFSTVGSLCIGLCVSLIGAVHRFRGIAKAIGFFGVCIGNLRQRYCAAASHLREITFVAAPVACA